MSANIDRLKTYAVVVGVEKYDTGPKWNLNGPASDAVRFVKWLRRQRVPDDQIFLFLSPLDVIDERYIPATSAAIKNVITNKLSAPLLQGDLLILFWGGHGVIEPDFKRRLFCQDATLSNKEAINFDSLLELLRTKPWSGFRYQLGFVDACANYYEEMRSKVGLSDVNFGLGPSDLTVPNQVILYAAAAGEPAVNNNIRRTGAFSDALLNLLEADESGFWPPDDKTLIREIYAHFEKLQNDGKTRQTPVHFRLQGSRIGDNIYGEIPVSGQVQSHARDSGVAVSQLARLAKRFIRLAGLDNPNTRDALFGRLRSSLQRLIYRDQADAVNDWVNILAASFATSDDQAALLRAFEQINLDAITLHTVREEIDRLNSAIELRALLRGLPSTTQELLKIYRSTASRQAPEARDLDQALENLLDMQPAQPGKIAPWLEFVYRVSQQFERPDLEAMVKRNAESMNQVMDLADELRQESAAAQANIVYVVIDLPSEFPSSIEYWFFDRQQACIRHDLIDCAPTPEGRCKALTAIANNAENSIDDAQVVVELFVPTELISYDVDQWEIAMDGETREPLGDYYPVSIRWRDRALRRDGTRPRTWRIVTNQIRERLRRAGILSALWIDQKLYPPLKLRNELESTNYGGCISFLFVPIEETTRQAEQILITGLRGGAPLAVWARQAPADWQAFRASLNRFLTATALQNLPGQLKQVRSGDDFGCSLILLWDDPERNPLESQLG